MWKVCISNAFKGSHSWENVRYKDDQVSVLCMQYLARDKKRMLEDPSDQDEKWRPKEEVHG